MRCILFVFFVGISFASGGLFRSTDDETILSPKLQAVKRFEEDLEIDADLDAAADLDDDQSIPDEPESSDIKNEKEEPKSIEEEDKETVDEEDYEDYDDDDDDDEEEFDETDSTPKEEKSSDYDEEFEDGEDEGAMDVKKIADPKRSEDRCAGVTCKRGRECVVVDNKPQCDCISECPIPIDQEDSVCGTDNNTYMSECEVWRTRCLYRRDNASSSVGGKHLRMSYYGPCKRLFRCSHGEMIDFPIRMRTWLKDTFLMMYDQNTKEGSGLHQRRRISSTRDRLYRLEMKAIEALRNDLDPEVYKPLYKYPVHWKFLLLDINPLDKYLSRKELEPLMASLIPTEPCTRKFFREADLNRDRRISLYEWGMSLGLQKGALYKFLQD